MRKLLRVLFTLLPATLVTADFFAARWPAENDTAPSPSTVLLLALLASQIALLSMWCAVSRRSWLVRLPVTLLGLLLLGLILVLGIDMGELTGSSFEPSPSLYNALRPFLPALVVAGPLLVLQCFDIAPVQHAPGTTNQTQGRLQFSIIHLVLLVTYVGMAFGMLKWMSQRRARVLAMDDRLLVAAGEITMLLFYALITLPTLWAALGRRRALLRSGAVLVAAPTLVVALAWYNSTWPENAIVEGPLDPRALAAATFAALHVLLLLAILLLVRRYRHLVTVHAATLKNASRRSPELIPALIATALVASLTVAPPTYQLAKQLHAASNIRDAGGFVRWEHNDVVEISFWRAAVTDQIMQNVAAFTNLRELSLYSGSVSDEGIRPLHNLSRLEELYVKECNITDAGLAHVAGLSRLESLTLEFTGSGITDRGLRHLALVTDLATLDLRNAPISGRGLSHLAGLARLRRLDLTDSAVTDAGLAHLPILPALNRIVLDGTRVTNAGLTYFERPPSVARVSLARTAVTPTKWLVDVYVKSSSVYSAASGTGSPRYVQGRGTLAHLKQFPNLAEVHLDITNLTASDVEQLNAIEDLKTLHLTVWRITDLGMQNLSDLHCLATLTLRGGAVTDESLQQLEAFSDLAGLSLQDGTFTNEGLRVLEHLPLLKQLSIVGCSGNVDDGVLEHVANLTTLENLDVSLLPMTDGGLKHLEQLTNLRTLNLSGTQVTDAGLTHLYGLSQLETLYLGGTQVTDAGLSKLITVLPNLNVRR